jgi:uncharacterized protein (DUF305 family)
MMSSVIQRLVAAIVCIAFAGTVAAGTVRATTATPETGDPCAVPAVGTPATGHGMASMAMNEEFDLLFLDMMIPHHESAIAMARVALERAEHVEIRTLAQDIIAGQSAEIDQMRAWRDAWYPGVPAMPMDQMDQMMMGLIHGMPGIVGTPGAGMVTIGGMTEMMDVAAETQALCNAAGPFDRAFLQMMIPHHQTASIMARVALQRATHPDLKQLAQAIVDAQEREIGEMQGWLAAWYGAPGAATPTGSPVGGAVEVTLTEFRIASTATSFRVGQSYRFVVTNAGVLPHEFMIVPKMPGMGQMDMASMDAVALAMIPVDDLPPGATRTIEVTFTQPAELGALEMVCTVNGHYDAGMALPITVTA